MPLPDANNYSTRIYELLKETDLQNLSYSQFQQVAETLFIEPENEDEMRRLVLVQLARMAVRGDWDGFLTGATTAPVTSLVAGTNITLSPVTGLGDVTINAIGGSIGGSITNDQIARGATLANDIEGSNGLLFDGTSLTVNTLTASDPVLNLASSTKSVSLEVNTSQKLSVKGSSDSFILDASSATGGITFPDGTTQITAASGGGGTNNVIAEVSRLTPSTASVACIENLTNQGGSGYNGGSKTVASMMGNGSFMYYRPFTASQTGTLSEVVTRIFTADAGSSLNVAFYDSDANGNPNALIGQASISTAATANSISATITPTSPGDMDLTLGNMYYCGYGCSASSAASLLGHNQNESAMIGYTVGTSAIGTGPVSYTHLRAHET